MEEPPKAVLTRLHSNDEQCVMVRRDLRLADGSGKFYCDRCWRNKKEKVEGKRKKEGIRRRISSSL